MQTYLVGGSVRGDRKFQAAAVAHLKKAHTVALAAHQAMLLHAEELGVVSVIASVYHDRKPLLIHFLSL